MIVIKNILTVIKKEVVHIENISIEELTEIISEKLVDKIEQRIAMLISKQNDEELLTRTETAELLKINSSTLWHWTNKGKITAYGIGNRRYYKRGEIMKALVILKKWLIKTNCDFYRKIRKALDFKAQIDATDKDIDTIVYELYDLTKEEIETVENS